MVRSRICSMLALVLVPAGLAQVLADGGDSGKFIPSPKPKADAPKAIDGIGPVGGKIEKFRSGFKFTEGPAADADGNVFFSDIPNQKIYKVTPTGKIYLFRENTNHANGLAVNEKGEVVACEMDGRIVAISRGGKSLVVLANQYAGKRFNAPNQLVLDKAGGIYFTDPDLRAPKPPPQGKTAVFYIAPDRKVTRLIETLPNPKGLCLAPDGKILYVITTHHPQVIAYPIRSPGTLASGRPFCTLEASPDKRAMRGGDGAAVDSKGNLYVATARGVQVFNPRGERLGNIPFPEPPSNLAFGGPDFKTLYVTASHSLYTAVMEVAGNQVTARD